MHVTIAESPIAAAFGFAMNRDEKQKAKEAADKEAQAYRSALAKRLVDARKASGMTQMELAHSSGISLASLQGYESGKREPHFATAFMLARALERTPQELLFGHAERAEKP